LKDNDIRFIPYVLDNVLTPLIAGRERRHGRGAGVGDLDKETRPSRSRFFVIGAKYRAKTKVDAGY